MNIGKVNNVSFGTTYYRGISTKNPKNEYYFGSDMFPVYENPKSRALTEKQSRVTSIIEKYLFPDSFRRSLEVDLSWDKKTDIVFDYGHDGSISLYLSKNGTGSYGDEYCFIPYNKDGSKEIKQKFNVRDITIAEIKKKTQKFLADCKAYLKDDDNPKNKEIENNLYNHW